jgi:hypothetical protein
MDANNRVTLSFSGTGVSLIFFSDPWSGIARIAVDGTAKGEVDTYSSPQKMQANLYNVSGLTNGAHTVTISPAGRKNANSAGLWVWVDAFDVTSGSTTSPGSTTTPPGRVEETSSAVQWSGVWSVNNNPAQSGGSARLSMSAGARATFTFNGTSVTWTGQRDQWSGIAQVFIDGVLKASVDMYAPQPSARAVAYTMSGLAPGAHTIAVEATGTKRSSSKGSWVWVDAFDSAGSSLSSLGSSLQTNSATPVAGGQSFTSSGGQALLVGSALLDSGTSGQAPSGLAIFGYRQNKVLVTEAGVPASVPVLTGRILAEAVGDVNTGLAMSNPNDSEARVSFFFTHYSGGNSASGSLTIPPHGQIARFLDEAPFSLTRPAIGTFTFSSTIPIGAIAIRGLTNERSEFLMTTLPIADPDLPNPATTFFPLVADGGGWSTQFALINPSDETISGTMRYMGQESTYSIPARGSYRFATPGDLAQVRVGSAEMTPDAGSIAPTGIAIFAFRNSGITVSEAGVPSMSIANAYRLYAEVNGHVRSGIVVQNNDDLPANVKFELTKLDGTVLRAVGSLEIPASGQRSLFLNEIPGFESLPLPFQGILRVSSANEAAISVLGLRGRTNERGDFLITTTPATDENESGVQRMVFPHFVNGDGYTTQFITFSGTRTQPAAGVLGMFSQSGKALALDSQ